MQVLLGPVDVLFYLRFVAAVSLGRLLTGLALRDFGVIQAFQQLRSSLSLTELLVHTLQLLLQLDEIFLNGLL